jgi:hypothetical protein
VDLGILTIESISINMQLFVFILMVACATCLKVNNSIAFQPQLPSLLQRIHNSFDGHLTGEKMEGVNTIRLGSNEIASGIAELELSAKKNIEADIKYYEGLLRMTRGGKSQLPLAKNEVICKRFHSAQKSLGRTTFSWTLEGRCRIEEHLFGVV